MSSSTDRKVQHNYRDHANVTDSMSGLAVNNELAHSASDRNFPVKLHFMLNELESDGLSHIVSWQPHGRCFVVHKQEDFVSTILPMWFRQSKFASFQRQLNLYGFKRLTSGRDKGGYYHELFLRSKAFLAYRIPRTKLKNEGARKSTSPETEPNFYVLPFLPEEAPRTTNRLQGVFAASSSATAGVVANESKTATSQGMDAILPPSSSSFLTGLDRWSGADLAALRPLVPPVADAWTSSSSNALFHPAAAGSLSGGMADPSALLWTQWAYQQALAQVPSTYRASGVPQWPGTPWIANDELNALRLALARNYTAASSVDQLLRNAAAGANLP